MNGTQAQDFAAPRARLVAEPDAMYAQTARETGLAAMSPAVRSAMLKVERHRLLDRALAASAYRNHPLPIGNGQTISQPYIVALSTDLLRLKPGDAVLDVGTGSGYQAAVLAEIATKVFSIEIIPSLATQAGKRLEALGYGNIEIKIGDGYAGWPEKGPFDGIVVTAAAPRVPPALVAQLKPGSRMVIPVGGEGEIQYLQLITKRPDGGYDERRILPVRFVPLVPKP
jgi:protein-L-isoaspartate(D-aspartate) O-methyltransferase